MSLRNIIFPELARIGKALASPKRLEIIDFLCQRDYSVEELAEAADASVRTVSHHLQILKGARLVEVRSERQRRIYHLREGGPELWHALVSAGNNNLAEIRSVLAGFFEDSDESSPVDSKQLMRRMKNGEVLVIDVRPTEEYEAGHFPGAVSLPLEELDRKLRSLPKDSEIIAYCRGPYCVLSHTAVRMLRERGLRARRWSAGVADWLANGVKIERGIPPQTTGIGGKTHPPKTHR